MADSAAVMVGDAPASVFQSDLPIETKIERARTELLDLSARNRLLNIPRSSKSAKIVEIVDEKSSEIFRMLLREGKAFTFLPGRVSKGGTAPVEADEPEGNDGEDTRMAWLSRRMTASKRTVSSAATSTRSSKRG